MNAVARRTAAVAQLYEGSADTAVHAGVSPALQVLLRDPALRSTDEGRQLLRMLTNSIRLNRAVAGLMDIIPERDLSAFEQVAAANAAAWRALAQVARMK